MNVALKIIITILVGLIIFSALPSNKPLTKTTETKNTDTTATAPSTTAEQSAPVPKYKFDVPALVGKSIEEIRGILGEPVDKEFAEPTKDQLSLGTKLWDNTFTKDDRSLLVTFDIQS
ncbi:MAG: hypothetical protein NTY48_00490, partial [Candidatus Diapherotrites archaeon]|nr:hypothetical protein [Candidatus Diapherotrites archaeon]